MKQVIILKYSTNIVPTQICLTLKHRTIFTKYSGKSFPMLYTVIMSM